MKPYGHGHGAWNTERKADLGVHRTKRPKARGDKALKSRGRQNGKKAVEREGEHGKS